EQLVVDVETDPVFVPVHAPDVKPVGPLGIAKLGNRLDGRIPAGDPPPVAPPGRVGEELTLVVLHDVDLAVAGPFALDAQRPKGGPQPLARIDPGPHFKAAVLPLAPAPGRNAR